MIKVRILGEEEGYSVEIVLDSPEEGESLFRTRAEASRWVGEYLRRLCAASNKLLDQKRFLK